MMKAMKAMKAMTREQLDTLLAQVAELRRLRDREMELLTELEVALSLAYLAPLTDEHTAAGARYHAWLSRPVPDSIILPAVREKSRVRVQRISRDNTVLTSEEFSGADVPLPLWNYVVQRKRT